MHLILTLRFPRSVALAEDRTWHDVRIEVQPGARVLALADALTAYLRERGLPGTHGLVPLLDGTAIEPMALVSESGLTNGANLFLAWDDGSWRARAGAADLAAYRTGSNGAEVLPRIYLLIDNLRGVLDAAAAVQNETCVRVVGELIQLGRTAGVHVVATSSRVGVDHRAVGTARGPMVLRQARGDDVVDLGVPGSLIGGQAPPGRAVFDGRTVQLAMLAPDEPARQPDLIAELAAWFTIPRPASPVPSLPDHLPPELDLTNGSDVLVGVDATRVRPCGWRLLAGAC